MLKITVSSKGIDSGDFHQSLMKVAAQKILTHLHDKLSSIRHPVTGKFPVVVAIGDSPDKLYVRAEGSPDLITTSAAKFVPAAGAIESRA